MEAVYDDMKVPLGFSRFAPTRAAKGAMFSARSRLKASGEAEVAAPVSERDLYG
jgi:hypothetical protein